jgi:hypothetical protein
LLPRCDRYATVGGYKALLGCDRLETMVDTDIAGLERQGARKPTHDRRASADVGYRVWNPFEAELQTEAGGPRDEVMKVFTRVMNSFER